MRPWLYNPLGVSATEVYLAQFDGVVFATIESMSLHLCTNHTQEKSKPMTTSSYSKREYETP